MNDQKIKRVSFQGITLIIAISRFVLLTQYLRGLYPFLELALHILILVLVAYYRRKHRVASWMYFLTPISIGISGILFLLCFVILKTTSSNQATAIVQFVLWSSAMVSEGLGHAFTPDDDKENLRGYGSVTARLSTMTVIVMGEGEKSIETYVTFC
jgi:hypothetical protein